MTRRLFSRFAVSGALGAAYSLAGSPRPLMELVQESDTPFGGLVRDKSGMLDLPKGFSYRLISRMGDRMDDGYFVPGFPDGMGVFPGPGGTSLILRNHELRPETNWKFGPTKGNKKLLQRLRSEGMYDTGGKGCVTTLLYDSNSGKIERQFLSAAGMVANCSGGSTPWGTWLSCEEDATSRTGSLQRSHGWVFEVASKVEPGLQVPTPLQGMGRFVHEGGAFDREGEVVYMTEDQPEGLFYRFIPHTRGDLAAGGLLQCLKMVESRYRDTRNWKRVSLELGAAVEAKWITLDNVDPSKDDLRMRGIRQGAAFFARGEGICRLGESIVFTCTTGGKAGLGQLMVYSPEPRVTGMPVKDQGGTLTLWLESTKKSPILYPDQIAAAPWGDLLVCEDGRKGRQSILGVTPENRVYPFVRNALDRSELSGVSFSPDQRTMFLSNLEAGLTFAVEGPFPAEVMAG